MIAERCDAGWKIRCIAVNQTALLEDLSSSWAEFGSPTSFQLDQIPIYFRSVLLDLSHVTTISPENTHPSPWITSPIPCIQSLRKDMPSVLLFDTKGGVVAEFGLFCLHVSFEKPDWCAYVHDLLTQHEWRALHNHALSQARAFYVFMISYRDYFTNDYNYNFMTISRDIGMLSQLASTSTEKKRFRCKM
jgi:hypothetical protein